MPDAGPLIAYASTGLEDQPADRLLRRIVGWSAVLYGAKALVLSALFVALSRAGSPRRGRCRGAWAGGGGSS